MFCFQVAAFQVVKLQNSDRGDFSDCIFSSCPRISSRHPKFLGRIAKPLRARIEVENFRLCGGS